MQHPHWTRKAKQSLARTAIKTVVYRVVSASSTILLAGIMFDDWAIAAGFGLVDMVANSLLYFGFERVWAHLTWRKER